MLLAVQEGVTQEHYGFGSRATVLVIFTGVWLAAGESAYGKCSWLLQSNPCSLYLMPEIPIDTQAVISEIIIATLEGIH